MNTETKKSSPRTRRRKQSLVDKARWAGYAVAGAATALAGNTTTEADVNYVEVDPDVAVVGSAVATTGGGFSFPAAVLGVPMGDGLGVLAHFVLSSGEVNGLAVAGMQSDSNNSATSARLVGFQNGNYLYAKNLAVGDQLSTQNFLPANGNPGATVNLATLAFSNYAAAFMGASEFAEAGTGYIGLRFNSGAGTQYGWMRVRMTGAPLNAPILDAFAWADPGEPLTVPEPGSLGFLAAGAAGLVAWRRKKRQAMRSQ